MNKKTKSFVGGRPVFTGAPSVEVGGYNVNSNQTFAEGDVIPAGTLCHRDESTRKVTIVKTGKVKSISTDDSKVVTLESDNFLCPCFAVGDKVAVSEGGAYASAIHISEISNTDEGYVITLSSAIAGLAVGDILTEVVSKTSDVVVAGVVTADNTNKIYMVTPGLDLAAGDKVYKGTVGDSALIADAFAVSSYDKVSGKLVTSTAITSCAAGDNLHKVFADATTVTKAVTTRAEAKFVKGEALTIADRRIESNVETIVDITMDTMQYSAYMRRILPIPASMLDANGLALANNPNIRFTNMK